MPNENLRFKKIFFCMEMITLGIKNPKCMLILNKMPLYDVYLYNEIRLF